MFSFFHARTCLILFHQVLKLTFTNSFWIPPPPPIFCCLVKSILTGRNRYSISCRFIMCMGAWWHAHKVLLTRRIQFQIAVNQSLFHLFIWKWRNLNVTTMWIEPFLPKFEFGMSIPLFSDENRFETVHLWLTENSI